MDECLVGTQCTSQSGQLQPLEYLPGAGLIRLGGHRLLIDNRYHRVPPAQAGRHPQFESRSHSLIQFRQLLTFVRLLCNLTVHSEPILP